MAIHSYLEHPVPAEDIAILVEFYDLVDGTKVEKTRSNTPTSHWPTWLYKSPLTHARVHSSDVLWSQTRDDLWYQ